MKKVIFQIDFDFCKNLKENAAVIEELFKKSFPRFNLGKGKGFQIYIEKEKTNLKHLEESDTIILKSLDGQKVININETFLNFSVEGSVYSSFESVTTELLEIKNFLEVSKISKVNKISIRKINIIGFKNTENPNGILDVLLNKALVSTNDAFPNTNFINHNIHSVNFVSNDYYLNLKYGINILPTLNLEMGQLIIDIDLSCKKELLVDHILNESNQINSEIFNVFDWVINDNARKILNDESI